MRILEPYRILMEYIKRGVLGDARDIVMKIRLMPRRLDWTSIAYPRHLNTALHVACTTRNDYMLDFLMGEGILACLEQENVHGDRPLHVAAKHSYLFAVNKFIEVGVKVNALNMMQSTPLMHAASSRDPDAGAVVRSLLIEGGNPALSNQFGQTAAHICSGLGTLEALELLLECDTCACALPRMDGRTSLHTAAHHGRRDLLETLLKKGKLQDSNVRASCGATPVMDALRLGRISTAAAFMELWPDTDLQIKDNNGRGCLQVAAEGGFVQSIKFLVEKFQLNPLDTDNSGLCSLHSAAAAGRCEAVRLLVSKLQVPVDVPDADGNTPLWWALQSRHTLCAEQLLQLGATPLPQAASASRAS